ncbi:NUDIX domain-containing protein [Nonomuraea sp. NPDC005650]|uniref:NUDIX hydrolase n=1 Tax=Nonomuraea sp. NPDC005650 TaxID=3157045 RepID=UPI0033B13C8A
MSSQKGPIMSVRLSAVVKRPDGRLLALGQGLPDNAQRHFLPGGEVDAATTTFEDALRRVLHEQLGIELTIGSLIHVDRTGDHDEYVFVAHIADHDDTRFRIPAPNGCFWDGIELTPAAVHAANFMPRGIGALIAGHLRHGRPPWALPDLRSRPQAKRRHRKTR